MDNSNKKKENDNIVIKDTITEQPNEKINEVISEQPILEQPIITPKNEEVILEQPILEKEQPIMSLNETISEEPITPSLNETISEEPITPSLSETINETISETIPNNSDENKLKEIIDESIQNIIIKPEDKKSTGGNYRKKSKKNIKKKLSKKNKKIKKYRHKYMTKKKSHHRRRRHSSRKNMRGGEFGASGWAKTMAGSDYAQQAARVGVDGSINMTAQNAGYPLMYQGGRKGGSVSGVLATATVPATLWASQYLYGKNKPNVYSKHKYHRSRKNRSRRIR